ncbi:hypothetical protein [Dermacoccus nishinomiyaensis]|uniref:hypothetical protein n=1 Tax=Dermacoccus nishinomiyaensis TaxID=1274 RepID=UPI000AF8E3BE|nr:hypothetical protein [Dermacoccus nishinomiyaensis]
MNTKDVSEVAWKVLQKRFLGGTRITEDRGQPKAAQQLVGGLADRGHGTPSLSWGDASGVCSTLVAALPNDQAPGEAGRGLTCTGSSPTDFPDASGQVIKTRTAAEAAAAEE